MLGRSAEGEYTYKYYRSGEYGVHLAARHAGEYKQISAEVVIQCP